MAIAIANSTSTTNPTATSPVTFSFEVLAGDDRLLVVLIGGHGGGNVSSVTYGGTPLTLAKNQTGSYRQVNIYYLVAPSVGTANIVAVQGSQGGMAFAAIEFTGVDQTSPIGGSAGGNGTSATPSLEISSASGDLVLDIATHYSSGTSSAYEPGVSQNELFDFRAGSGMSAVGISTASGAASVTTSWTASGMDDSNYAMASVSLAAVTVPSPTINLDSNLPVPTVTAGSDGVVESLPLLTLVNCYVDVPHSDVIESLPIFTISATAEQSTVIAGDCTLPIFTISSLTGYQTEGDADVDMPSLTASASSLTGEIHEGDCDVPSFAISATLLAGGISQGVATLPFLTFTGRTINTGTVSESVPVLTISAYAHGPLLHTLDESLPLLQIVATLVQQSTAFRCYVMNTENSAITEYDNFPFNSFCTFKGKHLAAGSNGITLLEGNKDNSTDIKAYFNVGNNDFDLPNIKKVTDAYLSMKGDGSYYLTVTSDDGTPHDYLLTATVGDRIKNLKTNVGKGKKGRYFELELSNIAGADFELYDMVLNVELLKRNI